MTRRVIAEIGRILVGAGVLILLFVAYELWGTNIREAAGQRKLGAQFRELVATTTTTTPPVTQPSASTTSTSPTTLPAGIERPPEGASVAVIRIPEIGLKKFVVEGVSVSHLKDGPGHYPSTPMPGQSGNAAIAGHRTTYGAPFNRLNELAPGDEIFVTTRQGAFRYDVREIKVVLPTQTEVVAPTTDDRLTLTTCHPKFSARRRLIVVASLRGPAITPPTTVAPPSTVPGRTPPTTAPVDALGSGESLSGERVPRGPTLLWALICADIWVLGGMVARRWRRVPTYLVATPIFLVALFYLFENVARLLPANV